MGGGIAQLASVGTADQYLVGQPDITYFKLSYRRHTLFAMESIQQTWNGTPDFGKKATVQLGRTGDLVADCFVEITLPHLYAYNILPTPAEGNPVDATALLAQNAETRHWSTSASDAVPKVVWWRGAYYLNSAGTAAAALAAAPPAEATRITTWPYLLHSSGTFAKPTTNLRWCNGIGYALMPSVEIEIGGSRIDRHVSEYWDIMDELSTPEEKRAGLHEMVGKYDPADYAAAHRLEQCEGRTYYVPLTFCFWQHPGLAVPMTSLLHHDVRVNVEFRPYLECVKASVPVAALVSRLGAEPLSFADCRMYAGYVFLDQPERNRFATVPHEMLLQTLQFQGDQSVTATDASVTRKLTLNFNHPVKELIWVYVPKAAYTADAQTGNDWFNYGLPNDIPDEVFDECKLVLNGHDRMAARPGKYFRLVQPFQHHTRCPSKKIHVYSFALHPEQHAPSGSANFSRYDLAQLQVRLNAAASNGKIKVFALGYNVLRVGSGMAGLAFAG